MERIEVDDEEKVKSMNDVRNSHDLANFTFVQGFGSQLHHSLKLSKSILVLSGVMNKRALLIRLKTGYVLLINYLC